METVETNPIYQFLKDNNLTTKDEKSFLDEYSNPQKANELYNFFKENELTTKDSKSFYDLYLKKKGDTTSASKDGGTPGDSEAQFTEENAKTLIPEDGKYKEIEGKEVEYEKTEPSIAGGMPVPTKKLPKQEDIVSKTLQEETKKFAQPELTKQVAGEMPSMVVNPKQLKEAAYPKNNFENVDQNTINETVRKSLVDLGTSSDIFRKSNPESAENINAYKKTLKIQGLSDEQINNAFDAVKDLDTERINVSAEEFEKTPPEGYFQGFFTSFNKAFSDKVLGNLDKASKFLSDITGLDYGGNFAKAKNVFDKYFVEGQTQLPKGTIPSAIIENLTNLAPDLVYTAFLPEMKLAALSNLTKGTITSVPKFSVVLGAENFLNEYDNTKGPIPLKIAAGMRGGLEGAKEGFVLEMLGYSHQKITKSLLPKFGDVGSKVLGTTANAGIFGTYDAANQLVQTGKIDDKQIAASMALAGVFGVPDIAGSLYNKAVSNFMTTPNDVLYKQYAQGLKVDLKTLRRQAEKKMSSDDAADKVAGQALNNMADNIAISNNVLYNPAPYIKQINDQVRSGQLTKEEGDFYISKINQFVAEADPRMEGIKPMSEKIKEVDMQIAAIEQNQFLPIEVKEAQSKALKEQKIDLQNQISNKLSQANKLPSKYATYTVDGEQLTREELAEKLSDSKFIENAKAGNIKINVSNDAEMYDNVIKAFSQEKTEQKTPEPSISGGPEEPSPTMEWSGEAVELKPKAEEAKPTVLVSDIEAKKADIERRRQEELKERVIYDRKPTVEDGEFRIVGDPNKSVYRINENTGRLQVKDRETGLWTVEGTHGKLELETAQRSGFEKLKENINAKYDAELNALKGKPAEEVVAERKVEAPKEEVKAEVQLEKPKVVISGTKNGFEILSEKNTEASEFVPSDARGKEADYDAEGFKTETDKDGNTVLNYKIKGNDAFGRRGYMQATVVLPKGLEPNKELVKQTVDQKIVELKEKRGISKYGDVDLNKLTKEDFSEISDAITESLTKPKVEEAKPAEVKAEAPEKTFEQKVEETAKALEDNRDNDLYSDVEDLFLRESGEPKRWFTKIGDAMFLKIKGLKKGFTRDDLKKKNINPQELNKERNDFLKNNEAKILSESYHKAKEDGSNPELVKTVEDLLGEKPAEEAPKEEVKPELSVVEEAPKPEVIKPAEKPVEVSDQKADIERRRQEELKNRSSDVRNQIIKAYKDKSVISLPINLIKDLLEFDRTKDEKVYTDKELTGVENIKKLKESIAKEGLKEPLELAINSQGAIVLTEGNHRIQALIELGYKEVPIKVIGRGSKDEYFTQVRQGKQVQLGLNLNKDFTEDKINAKYDAELAALEGKSVEAPKPEVIKPAEKVEAKEEMVAAAPKEGDTVELPPGNKYATANRVMVYKDGEWQMKVGREYTKVSEKFQQDAAAKWNEQNKPAVEVKEEAELPKMEGQDVPQAKFEGETFVPDNEILSNFTEVDELAKKLEESTNSVRKNKVQQEISEKMQNMTDMQKFVEQNADDIIETLKNKDILKSPCK